jgi:hypothetical protein
MELRERIARGPRGVLGECNDGQMESAWVRFFCASMSLPTGWVNWRMVCKKCFI